MSKLLAIGGPKHGQWLPNVSGYVINIPVSKPITNFVAETDPFVVEPAEIVRYIKMTIGNFESQKYKMIYAFQGMPVREAEDKLKSYLLNAFLDMEDPE